MNKIVIVLVCLLCISGCAIKHIDAEQSKENFEVYEARIKTIVKEYGYEITEEFDENMGSQYCYKDLIIHIDETQKIYLRMFNSSSDSSKGVERFEVYCRIDENQNNAMSFELELIVDVVNVISGKKITREMCEDFLQAPESEYALEKYGLVKSENAQIQKHKFLNFWEDWSISYTLDEDWNEILSFWGLTNQTKR